MIGRFSYIAFVIIITKISPGEVIIPSSSRGRSFWRFMVFCEDWKNNHSGSGHFGQNLSSLFIALCRSCPDLKTESKLPWQTYTHVLQDKDKVKDNSCQIVLNGALSAGQNVTQDVCIELHNCCCKSQSWWQEWWVGWSFGQTNHARQVWKGDVAPSVNFMSPWHGICP